MDNKEKTIYDLALHETLTIEEKLPARPMQLNAFNRTYEVTRVAGGWVYAFDYPGYRQIPIVFVPFNNEFMQVKKEKVINSKK